MNRMTTPLVCWSVSVACTAFLGPVAYAGVAGHAQFVNGQVLLSSTNGQSKPLQKGDAVSEGDTLTSATAASAQIRMQDGGLVAVRPDTQLKFDQFVFNGKQDGSERSFFSLLKGGFRAVTGLVGQLNKTNYRITTPVATIGIRGTDHETFLIVPGSPLALVAPPGAYSKVNVGATTLTTNQGSINVTPNQMGFAGGLNQTPLVQPINTNVFTVAQSPAPQTPSAKKEDPVAGGTSGATGNGSTGKEGNAPAGGETAAETAPNAPAGAGSATAPQDGTANAPAPAPAPAAEPAPTLALAPAPAPAPILRSNAGVDNVAPSANLIPLTNTLSSPITSTEQTTLLAAPLSTTNTTLTTTATTVSGGTTVNLTTGTTTTSSGQVVAISDGLVAAQAQTAAAAALAAYTAAQSTTTALQAASTQTAALAPVNTAATLAAIAAANAAIASATTATINAAALDATSSGTAANANASTAASIATSIASQLTTAQAQYTANGSFRDSSATAALSAAQNANNTLQTVAAAMQAAATTVGEQNALLTLKKSLSESELESANPALSSANGSLSSAIAKNTALVNAQSVASDADATHLAAAQAATSAAQAAASAAQAAATLAASLQASGDLTGAQVQLGIAQAQLAVALSKQSVAATERAAVEATRATAQTYLVDAQNHLSDADNQAGTAQSHAGTASTYAGIAQTAFNDAQTALTTTSTGLSGISSNAATVASQSAIAAYNNPAVGSNVNAIAVLPVGSAGSFHAGHAKSAGTVANTTVVLDGNGNLVEARDLAFAVRAFQNGYPVGSPIASANVKYTGGTAADTFTLADNSIYGGRWMGATVTVTDNNTPFASSSYTPAASLWSVIVPPAVGYVPTLTGATSYDKVAATLPVDTAGNTGVLNSATLSANFTTMTLDAGANLTMGSGTLAGTYQLSATGMAIGTLGGFESSTASNHTTACITGTCSAGVSGYSSALGGGLAGSGAASAGLLYQVWATTMYPSDPVADAIQGLVAFSTGTAPTVAVAVPTAYSTTGTAVAYTGSYGDGFNFIAKAGDLTYSGGSPIAFRESFGTLGAYTTTLTGPYTTVTPTTVAPYGIQYGLWESASSVASSAQFTLQPEQNPSMSSGMLPTYMIGQQGYVDSPVSTGNTGPLVGTFAYSAVAHASKDQSSWVNSTATSASLSANFTTQTVDLALAGTTNSKNWTLSSTGMPLSFGNPTNGSGVEFEGYSPLIKVATTPIDANTPSCATCNSHVRGTFTGQNYAGAMLTYGLWNESPTLGLNVGGMVAFGRDTPVTDGAPAATGSTVVLAGSALNQSLTAPAFYGSVLQSWGDSDWNFNVGSSPNGTAYGTVGSGSGAIQWGEWATGTPFEQSENYTLGADQFHWITAPEPTPVYLAQVLTSTNALYNLLGGRITGMGTQGTLNSGSTSLIANFSTQTVAINVSASVNGHNWLASTPNAPLQYLKNHTLSGFYADSYRSVSSPGYLTVTVDGDSADGDITGQLVSTNMDGAILKFNFAGWVTTPQMGLENVQGVAAFGAAVGNDPSTPYRMVLTSLNDPDAAAPTTQVHGTYNNANRITVDGLGKLTQFDEKESTIQWVSGTALDVGSATIGGATVNWGRWDAGTVAALTNRIGNTTANVTLPGGAHWIAGPLMTGPVTLPTTGTYSYSNVGNTTPTDQLGNTGVLNSASLQANFTAQTVNMGVNVSLGGATLNAVATGVPIQQRSVFMADSNLSGPNNLAISCSGVCGTTHQGHIGGGFADTGGVAAAMAYGLTKVGANAGTVSGVAVFQRP